MSRCYPGVGNVPALAWTPTAAQRAQAAGGGQRVRGPLDVDVIARTDGELSDLSFHRDAVAA